MTVHLAKLQAVVKVTKKTGWDQSVLCEELPAARGKFQ